MNTVLQILQGILKLGNGPDKLLPIIFQSMSRVRRVNSLGAKISTNSQIHDRPCSSVLIPSAAAMFNVTSAVSPNSPSSAGLEESLPGFCMTWRKLIGSGACRVLSLGKDFEGTATQTLGNIQAIL